MQLIFKKLGERLLGVRLFALSSSSMTSPKKEVREMDLIEEIRSLKADHGHQKPLDNLIDEVFKEREQMAHFVEKLTDLSNRVAYLEFIVGTKRGS